MGSDEFSRQRKEIERYIRNNNTTWKLYYKDQFAWAWSHIKKAPAIILSNKDRTASRPEGGSNPAVLATKPFSPRHHKVSVKIDHLGNWMGIGICDETFKLNDCAILGGQMSKTNGSLFHQGATTIKMKYAKANSAETELRINSVKTGNIVTVDVDFDKVEIRYYVNDEFVGKFSLLPAKHELLLGKLFPAIDISIGSMLTLVPPRHIPMAELEQQIEFMHV